MTTTPQEPSNDPDVDPDAPLDPAPPLEPGPLGEN
jgi:hypothetical protein